MYKKDTGFCFDEKFPKIIIWNLSLTSKAIAGIPRSWFF
jgi:hypothetical protein